MRVGDVAGFGVAFRGGHALTNQRSGNPKGARLFCVADLRSPPARKVSSDMIGIGDLCRAMDADRRPLVDRLGHAREFRVLESAGWSLVSPWWRCEDVGSGEKVVFAESSLEVVREGVMG